jgi:cytochrome c-type biogenesis protein CcmH
MRILEICRRGLAFFEMMLLALVMALAAPATAQQPATPVNDRTAHEVASQLRCVVCQNLSVADSPSEMATQMRVIVRERLAAGDRPDQVIQYFVDRYGEWILLAPRRHGFTLLVWLFPVVVVIVGLGATVLVVRRWTRRANVERARPAAVDPSMRERIRREMETEP